MIALTVLWAASVVGLLLSPVGAIDCPGNCTCQATVADVTTYTMQCLGLPETVPNGVSSLTVNQLDDSVLYTDPLPYANLETLNLSNVGLVGLDSTSERSSLRNLRQLLLANNRLFHVNATTFVSCPNLEELDLTDNSIKTVHRLAFSHLFALRRLLLAGNNLVALRFDLPLSLRQLDASNNHLEVALESGSLPHLVELNLCGNEYETFSVGELVAPNLSTLCLGDAVTSVAPNSLSGLANLTSLTVTGKHGLNGTARREFQKLTRLRSLTLSYLSFPSVSAELLGSFPSLQELRLVEIDSTDGFEPGALASMANLTLLDLRRSPALVASLLSLMSVERLWRAGDVTLADRPDPTRLDISENRLTCDDHLRDLLGAILRGRIRLLNADDTLCATPLQLAGQRLLDPQTVRQILGAPEHNDSSPTNATQTPTQDGGIYYYLDHWGVTTADLLYTILALAIVVLLLIMAVIVVAHYKCRQRADYRPQNDGSDESFMMRADSEYTFDNFTLSETMAECRRSPNSTLNKNKKASPK